MALKDTIKEFKEFAINCSENGELTLTENTR